MLVFVTYAHKPPLNGHADKRSIFFRLSHHLRPLYVYTACDGPLLTDAISNSISGVGPFVKVPIGSVSRDPSNRNLSK